MSQADLLADMEELAAFGAGKRGISRFPWTPEHRAASEWLAGRFEATGLTSHMDAAGNLFGCWDAGEGPAVLVGSHIDTVPNGGRYDGALGVLAALEAVRLLRSRGLTPQRPIWVVSFMDEEGSRFGTALFGSRAFVGEDLNELAQRVDLGGVALREAMEREGMPFDDLALARGIDDVSAYLELHIEQGPVLDRAGIDVGVVTGIVGVLSLQVYLRGEANHAGTTPMDQREDALVGAARAITEIRDVARRMGDFTATVGQVSVLPSATNIVPGESSFSIDVRSGSVDGFARAETLVREILARLADEEGLALSVQETHRVGPTLLDPVLTDLIERAVGFEEASSMRLQSGAGHDAMVIAPHVPTGMLFVPSSRGVSHSPEEFTSPAQCQTGAQVLARALELVVTT